MTADIYVAVDGKDANPGTQGAPLATLVQARDLVRAKVAAGLTKDVLVLIRGGTYPLTETLTFGAEDSGTEKFAITYAAAPGEKVVLSGGRRITGWKKGANEIWTAEIPEVKAGGWYFRQLVVKETRAIRARHPNVDAIEPWCRIETSSLGSWKGGNYHVHGSEMPGEWDEDKPVTVKLSGYRQPFRIANYANAGDIELAHINNNDMGRKRLASINEAEQTFTLSLPNRWNKGHGFDGRISKPTGGWAACYLENAREFLDQPGEWYLDRSMGTLSYWPRPGEDLDRDPVIAPWVQKTLLAVVGTREKPVRNLNFSGLQVQHADWPLPEWGYMGLFCSTIDSGPRDRLEHGFMEAGVEFTHARSCRFTDGAIAHVGGMGLCLRRGTADIVIEGNAIHDTGAGGIGVSEIRQNPIGQRPWNPMPQPGDYQGFRIANNHIFDIGQQYFGGAGIAICMMQDSLIAHNLIHDTAYSGLQWGGDVPGQAAFTRNNTVEFNHIYNAMKVTSDGAGMYVCYRHGAETKIRGNLIHDTRCNPFRRGSSTLDEGEKVSFGFYLDNGGVGLAIEGNVVYGDAGGPLVFNNTDISKNVWTDNLFQKTGKPPQEFLAAMERLAGLEPAYRKSLLGKDPEKCRCMAITDAAAKGWAAYQYDLPAQGFGVVNLVRRPACQETRANLRLRDLSPTARYVLTGYTGDWLPAERDFYADTLRHNQHYLKFLRDLPILSKVGPLDPADLNLPAGDLGLTRTGRELMDQGLTVSLGATPRVIWVVYKKTE